MKELVYRVYCLAHRLAKIFIQGQGSQRFWRMVDIGSDSFSEEDVIWLEGPFFNERELIDRDFLSRKDVFPTENVVRIGTNLHLKDSYQKVSDEDLVLGVSELESIGLWKKFILSSIIPEGYRYSSFHYGGFISDGINNWCLPNWIWTNAALVRMFCSTGELDKALQLANLFIDQQHESGGWLVRFDYEDTGLIPTLAPNDSAYIANNALLEVYKLTQNTQFLDAAKKCADWIISTSRSDGMVWSGYDTKKNVWIKSSNIVDTGFTAGLFASLYELTEDITYKNFLQSFINRYIKLFYIPRKRGFATSLNEFDEQFGGMFGRGQAWALEGLIPAYKVLKTKEIKFVIEQTILNLLSKQLNNGGWPYNLTKPLLGEDCKGIPVIAKNLLEWNHLEPDYLIIDSVKKALIWCQEHTSVNGTSIGGIFSYNMEGAIVHNLYSRTAFVYSSAYAIELHRNLNQNGNSYPYKGHQGRP